jgi:pentatricopeptide repeat protein
MSRREHLVFFATLISTFAKRGRIGKVRKVKSRLCKKVILCVVCAHQFGVEFLGVPV